MGQPIPLDGQYAESDTPLHRQAIDALATGNHEKAGMLYLVLIHDQLRSVIAELQEQHQSAGRHG